MIVRVLFLTLGIVLFVWGILMLASKSPIWPVGIEMMIFGALLIIGIGFERMRYNARARSNSGQWVATGEKFIDPTSGKLTEVYYNDKTGERSYRC